MAKHRTRNYSRKINPFTGEPWRTPSEFFKDAAINADERELEEIRQRKAYRLLAEKSPEEIRRLAEMAEELDDEILNDADEETVVSL